VGAFPVDRLFLKLRLPRVSRRWAEGPSVWGRTAAEVTNSVPVVWSSLLFFDINIDFTYVGSNTDSAESTDVASELSFWKYAFTLG